MKPISAHTSYPNTPESDQLPEVLHDVCVEVQGGTHEIVRLMAVCPMDAIERVREMSAEDYAQLQRVKPD